MATIKKYVKCPHCGSGCMTDVEISLVKFEHKENEILQKECLKLKNRIDKLQTKHDDGYLTNWQLNETNDKLSTLKKILEVLEQYI
uniref:Uncharacterized protein n=1 Tax=Siphoviridae sp. ctgn638 TaxID=2827913 RepID=A0A8S5TKR0_9CAUD|nr:MAG TPA: protein of unknown function (DUF3797) [Siphoviridae sp. ctgn638]